MDRRIFLKKSGPALAGVSGAMGLPILYDVQAVARRANDPRNRQARVSESHFVDPVAAKRSRPKLLDGIDHRDVVLQDVVDLDPHVRCP